MDNQDFEQKATKLTKEELEGADVLFKPGSHLFPVPPSLPSLPSVQFPGFKSQQIQNPLRQARVDSIDIHLNASIRHC